MQTLSASTYSIKQALFFNYTGQSILSDLRETFGKKQDLQNEGH